MKVEDLIAYFGSANQFAICCNFSSSSPSNWKKKGFIPIKTQMLIEKLTKGQLKADFADCDGDKNEIR